MKQNKSLHNIVQKLKRNELIRYATNLGVEIDEKSDMSKLRKAYTEFVLSHPKNLLMMLPKSDLDIIRKAKNIKAGKGVKRVDDHLIPIMVMYGLADIDTPQEDYIVVTIAEDLQPLLIQHIDWALESEQNQHRMSVEIITEGLANIFGIVTQEEIRKYLKQVMQNDNDEDAMKVFQIVRHYSLLLDSMEYAEDLENAKEEDIRFVSRYGWEDKRKMAHFIAQHSKNIDSVPVFSLEELAKSSGVLFPFIPNLKKNEFMHYLTDQIGFDELNAYIVCFNLWYYKIHYGEYSLDDMPMEVYFLSRVLAEIDQDLTDRQAEEGIQRLADFVDNLPLWHLRGFTAADYPSEAFVSKISTKEPLGSMLRKVKREASQFRGVLNEKPYLSDQTKPSMDDNPWAGQKIGRNDPCPCGSGLKYKKCHGKNL